VLLRSGVSFFVALLSEVPAPSRHRFLRFKVRRLGTWNSRTRNWSLAMKLKSTTDKIAPPRLGILLLKMVLRHKYCENEIGDLEEEYSERLRGGKSRIVRRWFWNQVISTVSLSLVKFHGSRGVLKRLRAASHSGISAVFFCMFAAIAVVHDSVEIGNLSRHGIEPPRMESRSQDGSRSRSESITPKSQTAISSDLIRAGNQTDSPLAGSSEAQPLRPNTTTQDTIKIENLLPTAEPSKTTAGPANAMSSSSGQTYNAGDKPSIDSNNKTETQTNLNGMALKEPDAPTSVASLPPSQSHIATPYTTSNNSGAGAPGDRGVTADPAALSGDNVVADTGGAVKGHRIDIWTPTSRDAMQFGRRAVKLTILELGRKQTKSTTRPRRTVPDDRKLSPEKKSSAFTPSRQVIA
jgi:3D (Asp-Asp-Asp) domain-containing protein